MSSRRSSRRFAASSAIASDTPVILPPGRFRLTTRPVPTGSPPATNTIGMVDVAPFAANAVTLPCRDDRRGAAADELGSKPGEALVMSVRIAVIDAHALSFGEARFRQAAVEFRQEMRRLGPRPAAEETEERGRRLRPRRARPERRRRAGAEDELPPPHSITSSERGGGLV